MSNLDIRDIWIQAPLGKLHARIWRAGGDKNPVVLFHDSLGCVALWRDFPSQLASRLGRDVIAYDRLGFGESDPYPGTMPTGFIENEASGSFAALREALELERFTLLGHSVGGVMAVCCAAESAQSCEALITISAQAYVEARTIAGIRDAEQMFAQPGQMERLARYHGTKAHWVLRAWVDSWTSQAFADWTLDGPLRRVRCPTLALHGDRDEYGSVVHPTRIAELASGEADVLEDCGHLPHREQPELVLAKVYDFLARTELTNPTVNSVVA